MIYLALLLGLALLSKFVSVFKTNSYNRIATIFLYMGAAAMLPNIEFEGTIFILGGIVVLITAEVTQMKKDES